MNSGTHHVAGAQPSPTSADFPERHYDWCLAALLLVLLAVHLAIVNFPDNAFIFDEAYYVPAARSLLLGIPSNLEHPPLAKLAIALSIKLFGDTAWAWRLPSVLFGTCGVGVLYLLTRELADRKTALLAAFLLSVESLWFVHSSIAMLDVMAVTLALIALLFFVRGEWVWAGAVLGTSMLAKETTVIVLAVLPAHALLEAPRVWSRDALRRAAEVGFFVSAAALLVFFGGLQAFDSAFNAFPTAFHNVAHMVRHNQAIAAPSAADAVQPFQWFSGFIPSGYLLSFTDLGNGVKRYYFQYFGQPNLVVVLLIWLALPCAIPRVKAKDRGTALHVVLFVAQFLFFLAVAQWRITYPYYMLVGIPSLCVLCATFLRQFPRGVILAYSAGALLWFLVWFPRNLFTLGAR